MKIIFEEIFPEYVHAYGNVISIPIIDTDEFNKLADDIRVADGKNPFFNEYPGTEMDTDAWYEIRLILDRETFEPVEIEFWADNCSAEDAGLYHVPVENPSSVLADVIKEVKKAGMELEDLRDIDD